MKARDIMVSDFPTVSARTPLVEAARILKKNFGDESYQNAAPGFVVLNDQGQLAGILSPLTIIEALIGAAKQASPPTSTDPAFFESLCGSIRDKRVEDVMDWQSISVTEEADLLDVAELFVKNRFQRIPVVKGAQVTGIIYRSRLLFAMAACLLD